MEAAIRATEEEGGGGGSEVDGTPPSQADAPPTESADESPAEPPIESPVAPTDDIVEAWHRWLEAGTGVPTGLAAFLRAAQVHSLPDGALEVRPIPGPAYERMSAPPVLEALTEAMGPYLSRRPVLVVTAPPSEGATPARITREEVREDTLRALYRQEPRLERAVQELDLELMD
jgi:hypothetical protein